MLWCWTSFLTQGLINTLYNYIENTQSNSNVCTLLYSYMVLELRHPTRNLWFS